MVPALVGPTEAPRIRVTKGQHKDLWDQITGPPTPIWDQERLPGGSLSGLTLRKSWAAPAVFQLGEEKASGSGSGVPTAWEPLTVYQGISQLVGLEGVGNVSEALRLP